MLLCPGLRLPMQIPGSFYYLTLDLGPTIVFFNLDSPLISDISELQLASGVLLPFKSPTSLTQLFSFTSHSVCTLLDSESYLNLAFRGSSP